MSEIDYSLLAKTAYSGNITAGNLVEAETRCGLTCKHNSIL